MTVTLCLSCSLVLFSWMLAFFIASYQHLLWTPNSIGVSEGPLGRVWFSLPYLVSSCLEFYWQLLLGLELNNNSTPTRSLTGSLKSNVSSSSSGNNCHAVQRSLSSGASVCIDTVGPSPCPIL